MEAPYGAGPASKAAYDSEARKIVGAGKLDKQSSSHTSSMVQAPVRAKLAGFDYCAVHDVRFERLPECTAGSPIRQTGRTAT